MEELTENQKRIYNCYLKHSRQGKPFQYRKNFDDVSEYILLNLKKLDSFFSKYKHINIEDFFSSPNHIYPDNPYPKLDFFNKRTAIKLYSILGKLKEDQNPEKQVEEIKNSFSFIGSFCIKNKILLNQYLQHKTGLIPTWMNHYRERKINPYCLMELGDVIGSIDQNPKDIMDLFSLNFSDKIVTFKTRYKKSQKTINLVREATNKISTFVKKELQKQK